ncbi:hypothetical protein ABIE41_000007 [Bosea sp. OAE506]
MGSFSFMAVSFSNLLDRAAIAGHRVVGRQQGDSFDLGLSNQDAIERIPMDRRQSVDRNRMLARDWQLGKTMVEEAAPQKSRVNRKNYSGRDWS